MKIQFLTKLSFFTLFIFAFNSGIAQQIAKANNNVNLALFQNVNVEAEKESSINPDILNTVSKNPTSLKVYPNPVGDDLTVSFDNQEKISGKISYKISDLNGRVLGKKSSSDIVQNFYLKHLRPGVYVLEINTGVNKYIRRIIKK